MKVKVDVIDQLEDAIAQDSSQLSLKEIFQVRREVITLHKIISSSNEVVSHLIKDIGQLVAHDLLIYLHDLNDHCYRLQDLLHMQREMVNGVLELHQSLNNSKLNETMKILTVISTTFIPLTFITGLYGMNFEYIPELKWHYGYYAIVGVMTGVALCLLGLFKKLKWF